MAKKETALVTENTNVNVEELKEELTNYIDKQFKKGWSEEVDKANKRLIREKNRKIIFRDIIILLLLGVIGYSIYILYDLRFFDKYFQHSSTTRDVVTEDKKNEEEPKKEEVKEPTLEELVTEYGYLLDNIEINENSEYIDDYYNGKLSNELKNYLALNNVDFSKITEEDDYNIIDEDTLIDAYYELFSDDHTSISFSYNGNKIRYLNKLQYYITDTKLEKISSNIKREIIDIKVDDNNIVITTIEGLVKDNKLYNIVNEKEVKNYNKDELKKYEDKLNEVIYTFKDGKLIKLG